MDPNEITRPAFVAVPYPDIDLDNGTVRVLGNGQVAICLGSGDMSIHLRTAAQAQRLHTLVTQAVLELEQAEARAEMEGGQ